jgi:hypothetical protein
VGVGGRITTDVIARAGVDIEGGVGVDSTITGEEMIGGVA